jgi:hypothetical protein
VRNKRRFLIVLAVVLVTMMVIVGGVSAITYGELDGDGHPHVVLLLMEVGGVPMYRCSGTLLTPTVLLTAGHCTSNYPDEPFTGMRIFTESDVDGGTVNGTNNYPYAGPNSVEAVDWAAHPDYETAPFWYNDVGVVVLAEPGFDPGVFGELPTVDELDKYAKQRGKEKLWFTAVGYGLQFINPVFVQSDKVRMFSKPKLNAINAPGMTGDYSLLLSNNHSTGGTCFGDSGGPNFMFDTNVVGGVTSFGLNGNCRGTGGVFRMDRQNVLDFVNSFLD